MSTPHECALEDKENREYEDFCNFVHDNYSSLMLIEAIKKSMLDDSDNWPIPHTDMLDFMREHVSGAYTRLWMDYFVSEQNRP